MTFTYSGDPSESDLNAVRFLIGDTEPDEPLLQDEEIIYLNSQWSQSHSVYWAASMAAEAIAARFAREVAVHSDSQNVSTTELQQKYQTLAIQLRMQHQQMMAGGYVDAGGLLKNEFKDPNVKSLAFGRGMHDDPEAGQQDLGDIDYIYKPEWVEP